MKRCVLLIFLLPIINFATAQDDEEDYIPMTEIMVSSHFQLGIPVGNFRDNLVSDALGGGVSLLVKLKESLPIYIGIGISAMNYDRASIRHLSQIEGYLIEIKEETKPSIYLAHSVIRLEPPIRNLKLQPYFEGKVGLKNLATRTKVSDVAVGDIAELSSYLEEGDWAFSYGATLGIRIPVVWDQFSMDIKCSYLMGNAAYYLVRQSDLVGAVDRPIDVFELRNSTTNLLLPTIGFNYRFDY